MQPWPSHLERRQVESTSLIAVIDDVAGRREALIDVLKPYYRVINLDSAEKAVASLLNDGPITALVAESLAPAGGYEFVKGLRNTPGLKELPVIVVVGNADKMAKDALAWSGGNRLVVWPNHASSVLMVVSSMCNLHVQRRWEALSPAPRKALKETLTAFNTLSDSIRSGQDIDIASVGSACTSLVSALNENHFQNILDAVKDHDDYTYVHCLRVAIYLSMFGHVTGLPFNDQLLLATGGLLHDVGKIGIPFEILNKPGLLSDKEFETMKTHVPLTVDLLRRIPDIRKPIITIAAQHHERLDGSGYPKGLKEGELDELARMAAIVDVFGALTDRRTYKSPMEPEAALNVMVDEMAGELDMRLVAVFRQAMLDAAIFSPSAVVRTAGE